MKRIGFILTVLAVLALVMAGCTAPPPINQNTPNSSSTQPASNPGSSVAGDQTGKIEVRVTDAPAKDVIKAILVTVNSVEVHKAGTGDNAQATATQTVQGTEEQSSDNENGWTTISNTSHSFDLLKVKDNLTTLDTSNVSVGNYTQVRLGVESVKVTFIGSDNKEYTEDATVPSGKIKFIQGFKVSSTDITLLDFDFDAAQSVNVTGNGKVMFKPVIKLSVGKKNEANNTNDNKGSKNEANNGLDITTKNLPEGKVGTPYSTTLNVSGGTSPYTWTWTFKGNASEGLGLNSNGTISGTPTKAGTYEVTVKVTDSSNPVKTDTKNYDIKIN